MKIKLLTAVFVLCMCALSVLADERNDVILSSVRLGNGSCSGTVIWSPIKRDSKHQAFVLTASHCVGKKESTVTVQFINDTSSAGRVIAKDTTNDLALIAIYSKNVMTVSEPSFEEVSGSVTAVGFPGGIGPKYKTLLRSGVGYGRDLRGERARWIVKSGPFAGGDSGGGVFRGGKIIGVMSHGDSGGPILSAKKQQVNNFLLRSAGEMKRRGCIAGWCKPNVPIQIPNLEIDKLKTEIVALKLEIEKLKNVPISPPAPPEPGPQGPKGDKGVEGAPGKDGKNGKDGVDANSIDISSLRKPLIVWLVDKDTGERIIGPDGKPKEQIVKWYDGQPFILKIRRGSKPQ